MGQSYVDIGYRTFVEEVTGALDGKENLVLELASDGNVQLFTGSGASPAVGVVFEKLKPGAADVQVRLLGKGGTVKVIQTGAITCGTRVKAVNGGRVDGAGPGDRAIGIKLSAGNGGAGDVIEILDEPESLVSSVHVTPLSLASSAGAITALTFSNPPTSIEVAALRDKTATLATDVVALVAALKTAGVLI